MRRLFFALCALVLALVPFVAYADAYWERMR